MARRPLSIPADTRTRLVAEARGMLEREGAEALSLRAVARAVGISAPSVYEHFESREALLDALAHEAHRRLRASLEASGARVDVPPLVAIGEAYVGFACREPEVFRMLFLLRASARAALSDAVSAESAYGVLLRAVVDAATAERGVPVEPATVEPAAYALWSLAHGIAALRIGHLRAFRADLDGADRAALIALVTGLGLEGRSPAPGHTARRRIR